MKKLKLLILGFLAILCLGSYSFASYSTGGYTWSDGFYWSESKGLITVITGDIVYTLMDKNLGATKVYEGTTTDNTINSIGPYVSASNPYYAGGYNTCDYLGDFYQFGNNHAFSCDDYINDRLTTVSYDGSSVYDWATNPLDSSSVIQFTSSSQITNALSNAWGGVTATFSSTQNMCPDGFSMPLYSDWNAFLSDIGLKRSSYRSETTTWAYYLKLPFNFYATTCGGGQAVNYFWSSDRTEPWNYLFSSIGLQNFGNGCNSSPYDFSRIYISAISMPIYFPLYGGNYLAPVRCFKNEVVLPDTSWVALTGTTEGLPDPLPDEPEIPDAPVGGSGNSVIPFSSLYYQCIGPSYNTPDGRPPAFCLDCSGNLIDFNDYKNCWFEYGAISGELASTMYCSIDGYVQTMFWNSCGSGGEYMSCSGDNCSSFFRIGPNYLAPGTSGFSTGTIFDMFTNLTGWVGKCPFEYTDFQLGSNWDFLKYLKTLGFEYDPFIIVNCIVAGFNYGRNYLDLDFVGTGFDSPILSQIGVDLSIITIFFDGLLVFCFIFIGKKVKDLF